MSETIRPTKKQRELLNFIEQFIAEHGYSPSFREIMKGLSYTSVATVALHVNNLIKRGHLRKRDHSARSLEVVGVSSSPKLTSDIVKPNEEKWLIDKIESFIAEAEQAKPPTPEQIDQIQILLDACKILGLDAAVQSFTVRLNELKEPS